MRCERYVERRERALRRVIGFLLVASFTLGIKAIALMGKIKAIEDEKRLEADKSLSTISFQVVREDSVLRESEEPPQITMTLLGTYKVVGYDPYCPHCCPRADGITASGVKAAIGRTCAMEGFPFGTRIYIDGLGEFVVEDRGVKGNMIDIACEDHAACYAITGTYEVYLINDHTGETGA